MKSLVEYILEAKNENNQLSEDAKKDWLEIMKSICPSDKHDYSIGRFGIGSTIYKILNKPTYANETHIRPKTLKGNINDLDGKAVLIMNDGGGGMGTRLYVISPKAELVSNDSKSIQVKNEKCVLAIAGENEVKQVKSFTEIYIKPNKKANCDKVVIWEIPMEVYDETFKKIID